MISNWKLPDPLCGSEKKGLILVRLIYIDMKDNYVNTTQIMLHVNKIMLHVDINKSHVDTIILHMDINQLHFEIIYFEFRGQKDATIDFNLCINVNSTYIFV